VMLRQPRTWLVELREVGSDRILWRYTDRYLIGTWEPIESAEQAVSVAMEREAHVWDRLGEQPPPFYIAQVLPPRRFQFAS
jgi:hypothetical protein